MKFVPAWEPYPVTLFSEPGRRSVVTTDAVIASLDFAANPRYTPREGTTFCNIALWDCGTAHRVTVPHWVDSAGNPGPMGKPRHELDANALCAWFVTHGARFGWARQDEITARVYGLAGKPAVALWLNTLGIGHVAWVIGGPAGVTWIAQAGGSNFNRGPIARGFGRHAAECVFWVNE